MFVSDILFDIVVTIGDKDYFSLESQHLVYFKEFICNHLLLHEENGFYIDFDGEDMDPEEEFGFSATASIRSEDGLQRFTQWIKDPNSSKSLTDLLLCERGALSGIGVKKKENPKVAFRINNSSYSEAKQVFKK